MRRISYAAFCLFLVVVQFSLILKESNAQGVDCTRTSVGFTPLNDMGANKYYPNSTHPAREEGGLYDNGVNSLPLTHPHMLQAQNAASQVKPRNASGIVDEANGKIGFISLGMSNTFQEFGHFTNYVKGLGNNSLMNPKIVLLNGAYYGKTANVWAYPELWSDLHPDPWVNYFDKAIADAGLTKAQVQVVWIKLTNASPTYPDDAYPVFSQKLRDDVAIIVKRLKRDYPSIKLVYFSSRTYGGYSTAPLSPEPSAYESAISFKWLINDQIAGGGTTGVNYDNSPILLWGPYLWADGIKPRSDGLTYVCSDFNDGIHPSNSGRQKVTNEMYEFFTTDPLARVWFTGSGSSPSITPPTFSPTPSITPSPEQPGDANRDGKVDGRDFMIWNKNYGKSLGDASNGDFNYNGKVDINDYFVWIANYNK